MNFREVVIDEVYDAAPLDLRVAYVAAVAGLGVTIIGDPRQALYGWRGAAPEMVSELLEAVPEPFVEYQQPQSFRFTGDQMPELARDLRASRPVILPNVTSDLVDVALARQWKNLWLVGDNILPLAFRNVSNATDAAICLLLDVATRAHLGRRAYGREAAIVQLGLDRKLVDKKQDLILRPILADLAANVSPILVLERIRNAAVLLGARRRPNRLKETQEAARIDELEILARRLNQKRLIPGLTVHQAKGREWSRVGVVLSEQEDMLLSRGLRELHEDDCVVYVALTRAQLSCGRLAGVRGVGLLEERDA